MVYSKKHEREIQATPYLVDIAGEQFRLKHIDKTKDIQSQKEGLDTILKEMKKSDWNVLPGLLEGLHSAGRVVPNNFLEKAMRLAARAGRLDVIVECARRVARTNFALDSRRRAATLMWWVQYQALNDNFSANKTAHTLRMAEQVAAMLEDEKHAGGKLRDQDPRTAPEVTGTLLELSAANAKAQGGNDTDGSVEKYANRFIATINKKELEGALGHNNEKAFSKANSALITIAPIRYGVKTALQVLDAGKSAATKETIEELKKVLEKLEAQTQQYVSTCEESHKQTEGKPRPLGLWSFDKTEELLA